MKFTKAQNKTIRDILAHSTEVENILKQKNEEEKVSEIKDLQAFTEIALAEAGGVQWEEQCEHTIIVQCRNEEYAVLDYEKKFIVPLGKYRYIDGFDHGYARFNIVDHTNGMKHWGIIDENGVEVVPAIYDNIWNFVRKNRTDTKMEKGETTVWFDFIDGKIYDVDPWKLRHCHRNNRLNDNEYQEKEEYGHHYGEFAGSYAQDVMGFSDDVINDAFEGDPDAYWNID